MPRTRSGSSCAPAHSGSGKAAATLTVEQAGHAPATLSVPEHPTSLSRPETQKLKLPHGLSLRGVRVCVAATDPSGNRATSCKKTGD
jgi:hypothetical protein